MIRISQKNWATVCPLPKEKSRKTCWMKATEKDGNPLIPTSVFQYFFRHHDPVIEGTALVACAREDEKPMDWNSRELDVHIW